MTAGPTGGSLTLLDNGRKLKVFGFVRVVFKIGRSQVWLRARESDLE